MLDFVFSRGVNGLVTDERLAMAVLRRIESVSLPSGGVGGLPADGFEGVSLVAYSRGLRNIAVGGWSRHGPNICKVTG